MEYLTITELTRMFNVSSRMIRYYEKMGLMESSRKENYAYRIYDEAAVKRLQQIIILRKLRIPLKEIGVILNDMEQREALRIMEENICKLDEEIDALNTIREILNVFVIRLNESVCERIRLDFLDDTELTAMIKILKGAKTNMKEEHSAEQLNNASEIIHRLMLMYGKEASNRKQEIDRQHHTIPKQKPKDKHYGNVHNRLFRHG